MLSMTRAHLWLPLAFAASAAAVAVACSSPPPPAEEAPPEATAPARSADPPLGGSSSGGTSSGGNSSGGAADAGDTDGGGGGGGGGDGGGGGGGDGGGGGGGSKCKAGSVRESERNDTPQTADVLAAPGSFCGSVGDKEVDHIAFVLPANATSFNTGGETSRNNFKMELIVKGNTQDLSGNLPFEPGERYVIKITNKGGAAVDYRVDVTWK